MDTNGDGQIQRSEYLAYMLINLDKDATLLAHNLELGACVSVLLSSDSVELYAWDSYLNVILALRCTMHCLPDMSSG